MTYEIVETQSLFEYTDCNAGEFSRVVADIAQNDSGLFAIEFVHEVGEVGSETYDILEECYPSKCGLASREDVMRFLAAWVTENMPDNADRNL